MSKNSYFNMGLDVGSTTVKLVILDKGKIIYSTYKRHLSNIKSTIKDIIEEAHDQVGDISIKASITGSGGLSVSKWLGVKFVQEVIASTLAVETTIPDTDVVIELGGEDAKITFFGTSIEQRMNGTCAGGTGAFIDQMASLLECDAAGLNTLAKDYGVLYPIASRCGVFAKTDVQPLLNEGAKKEDIAASVFQAVVNQTISGLACGKPIKGNIAFLGGPLYFLSELRQRFIETLDLSEDQIRFPDNSQLFVALGAAYDSEENTEIVSFEGLLEKTRQMGDLQLKEVHRMPPLFADDLELEEFRARHRKEQVKRQELSSYQGKAFLGIDAGSTTSKAALIGEDGQILYTYYSGNQGSPLNQARTILAEVYDLLPVDVQIVHSAVTGYGEALIKSALKLDVGEIETMAHYKGAKYFQPEVDFILDIGGQDMKCMKIVDGVIDNIVLNEACSSGCGSFLETFAKSLGMNVEEFAEAALTAAQPVDLGTRCTVFMNSRVKQAQKEGATVGEISAGLSYSVIKNALQKVIKIRNVDELGDKIVVQGGTFYSDAVLRAMELVSERTVIRPDISGIMGAFGAALIAMERYEGTGVSTMLSAEELKDFTVDISFGRCKRCTNNCLLTINKFQDGHRFISGNRCEKGLGIIGESKKITLPDMYEYKINKLSSYDKLPPLENAVGTVGIPRALNMYENFPFWVTFFRSLGYNVKASPHSSKEIFEMGMDTIPSESVCYPAKLVHGHIASLLKDDLDMVFYPCIPYEEKEFEGADNSYSCPIVTSYPETIKHNMDAIKTSKSEYVNFFVTLENKEQANKKLIREFVGRGFTEELVTKACKQAWEERENFRKDIQKKGEETLEFIKEHQLKGIVLAGRPYHVDPEIHHGIPDLIKDLGMAVLTEDSVSHLGVIKDSLRVLDQWKYHTRLYAAAEFASRNENLEFVQLTSFGCGIDAVTSDQAQELLKEKGRIYTLVKIDEGNNLGAIRIRLRSLKAAMDDRFNNNYVLKEQPRVIQYPEFTKQMRKDHVILIPQMSPIHFEFIEDAMGKSGYRVEVLPEVDNRAIDEGLKSVNNDACYPTILVVGQMMNALKSGKYDLNNVSLVMSQTGGPCRASNYVGILRKALQDAGMGHIPVISANLTGLESNPGFKLTLPLVNRAIMAMIYGDLFQRVVYRCRPYEQVPGSVDRLHRKWAAVAKQNIRKGNLVEFKKTIQKIVREFDQIPLIEKQKPRVGIVGEILVKYHPTANNNIIKVLEEEGAEVVVPDILDFFLYCAYNSVYKHNASIGSSKKSKTNSNRFIGLIEWYRKAMKNALLKSERFRAPSEITHKASLAQKLIDLGNQGGEGWFLTGEMVELIEDGIENIVLVQPFACLPNHVMGKGMMKPIREEYPYANIAAIDYDPGASEVNQLNRIKLMLAVANKNIKKKNDKKVKEAKV
ncbi:2-hydroxyacyl-CoA dehydratase [Alkalibacter rhizosphaerae]|uniref:2-hydroxyacyl-CoA dehydratase n=1 Tax=Alkalibacter rhizosphaerae TaxID=2815577 RepID=A0A975AIR6_9FIRM|nr:2-hydroxyacyl-CoA dehydratase [Alkalibacter rhizosphaerae]QSX08949.1 2-hydroxyacyl-CoA dehydratase [Alkalibacter rhizosphaerae]